MRRVLAWAKEFVQSSQQGREGVLKKKSRTAEFRRSARGVRHRGLDTVEDEVEQVAAVTAPAPAPYNHSSALYDYIFGDD